MKMISLSPELYQYVSHFQPELHPVLPELIAVTRERADRNMQISPEQGAFMHLLVKMLGAERVIEVGTFTGYSSICMGLALPQDGELITCDINPETSEIAQRYLTVAGLREKVRIELGSAVDTIEAIIKRYGENSFDLAFIDADKENYLAYYEKCLRLVRPGGVILVDNVLWSGHVIDKADQSPSTVAIRDFNEAVRRDTRVEASLLPLADGIFFIQKKREA